MDKYWYLEGGGGWFVVRSSRKKDARKEGVAEFGRGGLFVIREADEEEIAYYRTQRGAASLELSHT